MDRPDQSEVAALAQRHFGRVVDYDEAMGHMKAVLVILAADGVSQTERWAIEKSMRNIGVPEQMIVESLAWDPTSVRLEEVLAPVPKGGRRARELLRGAIRACSADGYSREERETVMKAAHLLAVEPKVVYALEALVELEMRIRDLGDEALGEPYRQLAHALLAAGN
jgi:hypothetical protein